MNLRQLSYFVRIAESGSFSAAADALHVAQSALSRHVKDLEDELGGALLDRGSRGLTLSDSPAVIWLVRCVRTSKTKIRLVSTLPSISSP